MRGMMLTAGLGTRLRPITDKWAKPAVPFLGIPLLKYPLWLMRKAGVDELVLNSHYKPEQIEALATDIASADLRVHVSQEPGAPLGAGGGIWKARPWLDDGTATNDFLVCNGDEVILPHDPQILSRFKTEHVEHKALATILVMKHPLVGTQFGGVWCDADGRVRGFGKDPAAFGADSMGYHYIGLLLLNARVFKYLPEGESNILYDGLASAIAAGEVVRVVVSEFTWFETGNPRDLLQATGEALALLATTEADPEVRSFEPLTAHAETPSRHAEAAAALREIVNDYWSAETQLEKRGDALVLKVGSAEIEESAHIKGFAVIENGARIETGATIERSIIMPGAHVSAGHSKTNEIVL